MTDTASPLPVAVATTSKLAARAGADIAQRGGNAVDAAIASALVAACTEPGVCALGCGGYVTIWPEDGDPVTIDGFVAIPGLGASAPKINSEIIVRMEYGGGVSTYVGASSVAVPGGPAALGRASAGYGKLPWALLTEPAAAAAESGFPLSAACHYYLQFSGNTVFGLDDEGWGFLHDERGLKPVGSPIVMRPLAGSLRELGERGAAHFYSGDLGRRIVDHVQARGGRLTTEDMETYEPIVRKALTFRSGDWTLATNPPPAIGGPALVTMLAFLEKGLREGNDFVAAALDAQLKVLGFRRNRLDNADDLDAELSALMALPTAGLHSPSTVHTSAIDGSGLCCSVTLSAGYGSGLMPPGTGIWLNNCLGEIELNNKGLQAGPPGMRLPSNMAPTAARRSDGTALAIGSPGADRITTALQQAVGRFFFANVDLSSAIVHPRLHVQFDGDGVASVAFEPGLDLPKRTPIPKPYDQLSMYFGGVSAAIRQADGILQAVSDPRRTGGTAVTNQ